MFLNDLVSEFTIENDKFEVKLKLNTQNDKEWLKTIAGFANSNGGSLFFGVSNDDFKLIGFEKDELDTIRNTCNNKINEHIIPRPECRFTMIPYIIRDKQRYIVRLDVEESNIKPVILKYNGEPAIYKRRDGFTNGATYEEIIDMSIKSKNISFDTLKSTVKYDRNNFKTLFNFYKEHNDGKELTDKALESIGFFDENGYLANGALLFMDDYCDTKTNVYCSLYRGLTRGDDRILSSNTYKGNIINSIFYIMDYVNARMNHSLIKKDTYRVDIDAYPNRALFEGIINAIAHRDYYIDGSQIQVDMFKDRLEISSPGSFYKGEDIKKTYDLNNLISKRRNELICNIFVMCKVMEAKGTGFEKILDAYKDEDNNHRPYVYSTSDHFTLVLPDITYSDGISDSDMPKIILPKINNPSKYDEEILSFCYRKERTVNEIAQHLGISISTYFRKIILENLVKESYLIKKQVSKTNFYKTNSKLIPLQ